jgi:hypothetical protein
MSSPHTSCKPCNHPGVVQSIHDAIFSDTRGESHEVVPQWEVGGYFWLFCVKQSHAGLDEWYNCESLNVEVRKCDGDARRLAISSKLNGTFHE